jgi:hypothetical protein
MIRLQFMTWAGGYFSKRTTGPKQHVRGVTSVRCVVQRTRSWGRCPANRIGLVLSHARTLARLHGGELGGEGRYGNGANVVEALPRVKEARL